MNKKAIIFLLVLILPFVLSGQSSVKGSSINGSTGIITSPTARIGWEYSDFGMDFGYSFLYNGSMDHVPTVNFSILRKAEIGAAFAIHDNNTFDLLINGKFQFYKEGASAVAMGVNVDIADIGGTSGFNMRPYLVASYGGNFFKWPAVTSMMFGWNMIENGSISSNFAFSMGFELSLFPKTFKNYIYWITDFGNYSYATSSIIAEDKGTFNTGIRIDPVKNGKFKFVIDVVGTDLLDASRGFMASAAFGFGF